MITYMGITIAVRSLQSIRETEAKLKATQAATAATAQQAAPAAPKKAKAAKQTTAKDPTPTTRDGSKKAIVLDMLKRPEGATLKDIMSATAWS